MAFSIREISSAINRAGGLSRKPHFSVSILPPRFLSYGTARRLEYLCSSASLPGVHLDSVAIRPQGYGTPENRPNDVVTNNVRMNIMMDNNGEVIDFFHRWIGNIVNFSNDRRSASNSTDLNFYEFAYPEEYEGNIELYVYNGTFGFFGGETLVTKFTLNQAYPIDIGDVDVSWDSDNEVNILPVTFAYNIWTSISLPYDNYMRDTSEYIYVPRSGLEGGVPTEALQQEAAIQQQIDIHGLDAVGRAAARG